MLLVVSYLCIALMVQSGLAILASQSVLANVPAQSKACTKGKHWGRCEKPSNGRRYLGCCQHPR
jgi:hypothetical protein